MFTSHIPAEVLGQFRNFLKALTAEIPTILDAQQNAKRRLHYLSRRGKLTSWAQQNIASQWQDIGEANRVSFIGPIERLNGEIFMGDIRPSPAEVRLDKWGNDAYGDELSWEPNIGLLRFEAVVARGNVLPASKVRVALHPLATVSAHAICRRVQRGGGTMMQAAREMQGVPSWSQLAANTDSAPFIAPTQYGYWAGQVIRIMDDGPGTVTRDGLVRTWISSDNTFDPIIDKGVEHLRTIGPTALEAGDLMRKLAARRPATL